MKKAKFIGCFILMAACFFLLGGYMSSARGIIKEVQPHQWVFTSVFTIMFTLKMFASYKELTN